MSTNARRPTCDIKTNHLIPNEAADACSEVEILSDMPVTKNVVERKQDKPDKDVAGYVTNVGRTNHLKSHSKNLDFHLANHRGQSIRVTLWGNLGDVLIEKKKTKQTGLCPVILSATCPNKYNNKVYLSSTSSTVIYDDDAIPAIKALKKANSVVDHQTSRTSVDLSQPRAETLEKLLILSPSTVRSPLMESGQGRDGTFLYVGATPNKIDAFTFHLHDSPCRYRLEVDVSDNTAQAVVVMFNETATALVNCSADSLMDTVDESSEDHLNLPPALSNLIGIAHSWKSSPIHTMSMGPLKVSRAGRFFHQKESRTVWDPAT
nr:hypothetical protein [Tanacetum cinerariifolium]